ncbi:rhomboid family intramembrane serine protease [Pseudomonadales bacterium]|nr:rhomboid family intramembrane serine protease [Pseudomonadales bacterium]
MIRLPWLTFILILTCCVLYLLDVRHWTQYDRASTSQYFRFFTAAFSHYTLAHLASNSLVLLVLGTVFEKRCHPRHFFVLTLVVVVTTVMSLHFFLPEYVAYAGISCLNFALMGWLLSLECARNPAGSAAALVLLVSYEFYVVVGAEKTFDTIQPAWQLHLLAFIEGVGFYCFQRLGLRERFDAVGVR